MVRPTLDPDDSRAVKVPGVWMVQADVERLDTIIDRVVRAQSCSRAHARRSIFLAGIRATESGLDALDSVRATETEGKEVPRWMY